MDLKMKYTLQRVRKNFRVIFRTSDVFIMIFGRLEIKKKYKRKEIKGCLISAFDPYIHSIMTVDWMYEYPRSDRPDPEESTRFLHRERPTSTSFSGHFTVPDWHPKLRLDTTNTPVVVSSQVDGGRGRIEGEKLWCLRWSFDDSGHVGGWNWCL